MTWPDDHYPPNPAVWLEEERDEYKNKLAALLPVVNNAIYNLRKGRLTKAQIADRLEAFLKRIHEE